ncbi:MAG: hypothetical protein QXO97_05275 [Candidatus Nezhaarchaeales archaeon]
MSGSFTPQLSNGGCGLRNVLSLKSEHLLVKSRKVFVGLVRSYRARIGRIRAVVERGREGEGEDREGCK